MSFVRYTVVCAEQRYFNRCERLNVGHLWVNIYELFQKMLPYGENFRRRDGEYTYDGVHLILPPCGGRRGGGGGECKCFRKCRII